MSDTQLLLQVIERQARLEGKVDLLLDERPRLRALELWRARLVGVAAAISSLFGAAAAVAVEMLKQ